MMLRPLGLALLLATAPAWGASTKTLAGKATASVANSCVIASADNLDFGTYNPTSATPVTAALVRLRCTKAAAYSITNNNASMTMASGQGDTLAYGLFSDSGLSKMFGVGGGSGSQVNFVPGQYYCFSGSQATRPS